MPGKRRTSIADDNFFCTILRAGLSGCRPASRDSLSQPEDKILFFLVVIVVVDEDKIWLFLVVVFVDEYKILLFLVPCCC